MLRTKVIRLAHEHPEMRSVLLPLLASTPKVARSVTLTFHSDPGHGWLEVPKALIKELGIDDQISAYSYAKGPLVYLEEDLDAGIFIRAAEAAGIQVHQNEKSTDDESFIRGLRGYRP